MFKLTLTETMSFVLRIVNLDIAFVGLSVSGLSWGWSKSQLQVLPSSEWVMNESPTVGKRSVQKPQLRKNSAKGAGGTPLFR